MSELTEHLRHIGCLNKPRCIEAADLLDAQATELARLREQVIQQQARVVAQQARIVELRTALTYYPADAFILSDETVALANQVLATTDDLSALAEHDKQVWSEAIEECDIHFIDDDTEWTPSKVKAVIRSLKR